MAFVIPVKSVMKDGRRQPGCINWTKESAISPSLTITAATSMTRQQSELSPVVSKSITANSLVVTKHLVSRRFPFHILEIQCCGKGTKSLPLIWLRILFHAFPHLVLVKPDGIGIYPDEFLGWQTVDHRLAPDAFHLPVDEDRLEFQPAFSLCRLFCGREFPFPLPHFQFQLAIIRLSLIFI